MVSHETTEERRLMKVPRLRQQRESRGLTQQDLAVAAGVSRRSVAGWELGAGIRPNSARKVAQALAVDITDLLAPKLDPREQPIRANFEDGMILEFKSIAEYWRITEALREHAQAVEAGEYSRLRHMEIMDDVDSFLRAYDHIGDKAEAEQLHRIYLDLLERLRAASGLLADHLAEDEAQEERRQSGLQKIAS
jgi:transcriptional regulator with XRE-family HTH domain